MKNYIFLLNALALTSASLVAMEKTDQTIALGTSSPVAKRAFSIPPLSKKAGKHLDTIFDKHSLSLGKQDPLKLDQAEKDRLVSSYQIIHTQLSMPDQANEDVSALRSKKQKIYEIANRLFPTKLAAKQWLKQADYFTDEEKAQDAMSLEKTESCYPESRIDYYTAKRSLAIQKHRKEDITGLEETVKKLKKEAENQSTSIAQLTAQLKKLNEEKASNEAAQAKIASDLQATKRTIDNTDTIVINKREKLQSTLKLCVEKTARLKKELVALKASRETLDHDKAAQSVLIAAKNTAIAQLELEQTAIQRDIDLLNQEYHLGKAFLWKFAGMFNYYPVKVEQEQDEAADETTDSLLEETENEELLKEKAE